MVDQQLLSRVLAFVRDIGIGVEEGAIPRDTVVPGVDIVRGRLLVDVATLRNVGDVLHDAAHIALTRPADREALDAWIAGTPSQEMAALGWAWAAGLHLGLAATDVFHEGALSGAGAHLRDEFLEGRWIGVPMLRHWGLTSGDYPNMARWTRA